MYADIMLGLIEDIKAGLLIVEAHICKPNQPPEVRAELRGRELAYRVNLDRTRKALCQMDRAGKPSNIEGAIAHIEAAERLLAEVKTGGYKSEYCKGVCGDSLTASRRALIGLWNVVSEESISGA